MAVIRGTEKAAHDLFLAGLVKGTTHLAAGHEAVAVGASLALRPNDSALLKSALRPLTCYSMKGSTRPGCPASAI